MKTASWKRMIGTLILGALVGGSAVELVGLRVSGGAADSGEGLGALALSGLIRQATAEMGQGEYEFFPYRRTVWVVNRTTGRMATYRLNDDEVGSVDRSRVATLNLESFPREDTVILLSDRNVKDILWVCNRRTGDVQMWTLDERDASLKAHTPIACSTDLSRPAASGAKR